MNIKAFSQESLIRLMNHEGTVKQWFSNPERVAFIRISSSGLNDFPIEFPDENIIIFDFPDLEEEEYLKNKENLEKQANRIEDITGIRPRYLPITDKEAKEMVKFVLSMKEKGIETLYIHCDAGKSRSPSVAHAVAKYILEDEQLTEYFDMPSYNLNQTVIKKIKKAYRGKTMITKKSKKTVVKKTNINKGR